MCKAKEFMHFKLHLIIFFNMNLTVHVYCCMLSTVRENCRCILSYPLTVFLCLRTLCRLGFPLHTHFSRVWQNIWEKDWQKCVFYYQYLLGFSKNYLWPRFSCTKQTINFLGSWRLLSSVLCHNSNNHHHNRLCRALLMWLSLFINMYGE